MGVGQLAGRGTKQVRSTPRLEVNAQNQRVCTRVNLERSAVTAGRDGAGKQAFPPCDGLVDTKRVLGEG